MYAKGFIYWRKAVKPCVYDATLSHFYGHVQKWEFSPAWRDARKLPKGAERKAAFQNLRENFSFEKKHFGEYLKKIRVKDLAFCEWTHSAEIASVANKDFSAVERFIHWKA